MLGLARVFRLLQKESARTVLRIETPAFDGVLTPVQSSRTREFRWFIRTMG